MKKIASISFWSISTLCTVVWAASFFSLARAQDLAKRLILKDGSYQLVTKYEVKGDRVRYYSAERDDWEELPNSLVDWKATEQYEKDREAGAAVPEAVQLDKEIEHEREMEAVKLPEVAPGLRLPEDSGVFLLDSYQGETQLDELQQTAGDVDPGSRAKIFRNPLGGGKQNVELEGAHAPVQAHVDVPALYIKPETAESGSPSRSASGPQQPQQPAQAIVPFDRFRIVRTEVKSDKRILGDVKRLSSGKIGEEQHAVKTTITNVTGGWLKLTPVEPLGPGEYAVIEVMGSEGVNGYVWDFGVNPKAPANANPWKAEKETTPAAPAAAKPAEKNP